ncbi:MAG: fatty acid desaturase family protein [Pseudomonadota bacterium]
MSAVAKIDGKALLGAQRWLAVVAPNDWRGIALVIHAWLTIAVAAALAIVTAHPVAIVLAIAIIGSRQLGLSILMHEAAHGTLLTDRRRNDVVGQWLCALPLGIDMHAYRGYHMKHHRFAQQSEDPDLALSAKFPVTRFSMLRKMLRDITGLTFLRLRIAPLLSTLIRAKSPSRADVALIISNALGMVVAWSIGGLHWFILLWLVPLMTWEMLVTRLRNIAEHACVGNDCDPWRVARTTRVSWLERMFIAPYYVNYHAEHHMFMTVPCYRLPLLHKALGEQGLLHQQQVPVAHGYFSVVRTATGERS